MNRWLSTGSFAWLVAAGCLLALAGSARAQVASPATEPTASATQAAQPAGEQLKLAGDAAWAVFQTLRDYVHAAQMTDDPQQRAKALADAQKRLGEEVSLRPGGDPESLSTYVSLWPAVVARYVDGFQRDRMKVIQAGQQVMVIIVAANPDDQKVHDQLLQELTKSLQDQGHTGEDLTTLRDVRLRRELAQQGIGYPVAATIVLNMRNVNGQWKATELDLRPPHGPTSQPGRRPSIRVRPGVGPANNPATQPAQ